MTLQSGSRLEKRATCAGPQISVFFVFANFSPADGVAQRSIKEGFVMTARPLCSGLVDDTIRRRKDRCSGARLVWQAAQGRREVDF